MNIRIVHPRKQKKTITQLKDLKPGDVFAYTHNYIDTMRLRDDGKVWYYLTIDPLAGIVVNLTKIDSARRVIVVDPTCAVIPFDSELLLTKREV